MKNYIISRADFYKYKKELDGRVFWKPKGEDIEINSIYTLEEELLEQLNKTK